MQIPISFKAWIVALAECTAQLSSMSPISLFSIFILLFIYLTICLMYSIKSLDLIVPSLITLKTFSVEDIVDIIEIDLVNKIFWKAA